MVVLDRSREEVLCFGMLCNRSLTCSELGSVLPDGNGAVHETESECRRWQILGANLDV